MPRSPHNSAPPSGEGLPAELAAVRFDDDVRASLNFKRIAAIAPEGVLAALPNLLVETPDPDAALNGFERLVEAADKALLRSLEQHPNLIFYALTVFAYSKFLGDTLIQNLDLFSVLLRDKGFNRSRHGDEYRESLARFRARSLDGDTALLMARFKRREYIRIMLRDVLGIATLAETTAEISALADVLIEEALRESVQLMRNRYGAPRLRDTVGRWTEPGIAILSLGKLGGGELNYSSDVDLLFLYEDDESGEGAGDKISNREYFIRLAQQVTDMLSRSTAEGPVFRIDLRLRPQGREGEPAVGLRHCLRYYRSVAHDWEIQAMIKARHCAGDAHLSRTFLHEIEPLIYRSEVNFPAIETAMNSLHKISRHHRSSTIDVKTDRGGIRDIEFLAQCLQRVYGGGEPWLRSGGTLFSIHKLHDKGHLSGKDFHELSAAYEFLRKVEHRLQLRLGQQTHRLPSSGEELATLWRLAAASSSLAGRATQAATGEPDDAAAEIERLVRERMSAVAEIYNRIIHRQQVKQELVSAIPVETGAAEFQLESAPEPGSEPSFQQMMTRLAADSPGVYQVVARHELGQVARRNLQRFFSSAHTSSDRYSIVIRNPEALERALALFESSEFISDLLVRHPEELTALSGDLASSKDEPGLFKHEPPASIGASSEVSQISSLGDFIVRSGLPHNERLAALRQHFRHKIVAAAARDILAPRSVYDSLAEVSAAAFDAIRAAMLIADAPDGFAVLALGRLGTNEHDLASDADLLFVCADDTDMAAATAAAAHVTQALAAYTREGTVFSVDTRLRPRGVEGELVVTIAQLTAYLTSEAQPWEALSYTKIRPIAGDHRTAHQAVSAAIRALPRFANAPDFAESIRAMRARLERADTGGIAARRAAAPDVIANFKTAPGGFYDVDFIASFLLVRQLAAGESSDAGSLFPRGNIRDLLASLEIFGALPDADGSTLQRAAELLRATEHVVRLVQGRARKSLPTASHARAMTESLVSKMIRRELPGGLEAELRRSAAAVREALQRLIV